MNSQFFKLGQQAAKQAGVFGTLVQGAADVGKSLGRSAIDASKSLGRGSLDLARGAPRVMYDAGKGVMGATLRGGRDFATGAATGAANGVRRVDDAALTGSAMERLGQVTGWGAGRHGGTIMNIQRDLTVPSPDPAAASAIAATPAGSHTPAGLNSTPATHPLQGPPAPPPKVDTGSGWTSPLALGGAGALLGGGLLYANRRDDDEEID